MSKILILAEKPSVALDISKALDKFKCRNNYFESESYVLVSSFGHLLSLFAPNDPIKGKWNLSRLPVIPTEFKLEILNKRASERLKLLAKLANREDIRSIINACDAGREGELIFRYIMQFLGIKKPIKRLWLQSMTQQSIVDAFSNLRDDKQLKPLEAAARSRAEADWLIGINGTRAMTAFNSQGGGFFKTPVGRVQTPTLAIVFTREKQILNFNPAFYWELYAKFQGQNGFYEGKWFDPNFKRNDAEPEKREYRLWSRESAENIASFCKGKSAVVTEEIKLSSQLSPVLYDLTSLQKEANNQFGFSAQSTLNIAQSLYEKHKAITYPRTDSRCLPEDFSPTVLRTIRVFSEKRFQIDWISDLCHPANKIVENHWVDTKNRRIFNDEKVSDHFAIMPTSHIPTGLSEIELRLYNLIAKRFLSVFFPAAQYRLMKRLSNVEDQFFKTEKKILVVCGWLELYGFTKESLNGTITSNISGNEKINVIETKINNSVTKPPAHYNESTLLSAMEGAGKFLEDEEFRDAMRDRGLGTPATRSAIIEGLLNENYLYRKGRDLTTTAKACQLMTLLCGLGIKELISPELTGEWEFKLKKIEKNHLDRTNFMEEITKMAKSIVEKAKEYELDTIPGNYAILSTPCPKCSSIVKENYQRYACTECDFSISKNPGKRILTLEEVQQLIVDSKLGPLKGFISRLGKPFSAMLRIDREYKLQFDFGKNDLSNIQDLSHKIPIGKCPKCSSRVFEYDMEYACEKSAGSQKECTFRSGKVILQKEISRNQMEKLLSNGRTDILDGFISNRTNRKFKVCLIRKTDGNIGFEFEKKPKNIGPEGNLKGKKIRK